ncbi:MAG: hypothetical protein Roseis2KO_43860 [Roseivirga sp.]
MKYLKNIVLVILLVTIGLLSSCDQRDTEPEQINLLNHPFDSGGDDDDNPIIIGDTTKINP